MLSVSRIGIIEKKVLEILLGNLISAILARKEILAFKHRIYKFAGSLSYGIWVILPVDIADEVRSLMLHSPLCVGHLRWPVRRVFFATDATPSRGGSVSVVVPSPIARSLYRGAESIGGHVRFDHSPVEQLNQAQELGMCQSNQDVNELVLALPWKVRSSYSFDQTHHINLQELRAVSNEVKRYVRTAGVSLLRGGRQVIFVDSAVVVGALGRCRSSSFRLNGILRSLLPFLLLGNLTLCSIWIPAGINPGDYPSRRKRLPPPLPPPRLCSHLLSFLSQSSLRNRCGVELFVGVARVTAACRARGMTMLEPWDLLFQKDCLGDAVLQLIRTHALFFVCLSAPCSSFSTPM